MNRNTTLALLCALALVVGYLLLVQIPKDRVAAAVTPSPAPARNLWTLTPDQVHAVRVEALTTGQQVAFEQSSLGGWIITAPESQPADANQAASVTGSLANLFVTSNLTPTADLGVYGLANPAYRLTVSLTDGTTLTANIGDQAPTGNGYYVQIPGAAQVALINAALLDSVLKLVTAPPYLPTPTPAFAAPTP